MERVQKIISNSGYCSRRKAEDLISAGKVIVNDKIVKLGDKADPEKDEIIVEGLKIKRDKKIYIMLNKPKGYVCSLEDSHNKKGVIDLINIKERIYPIGRLDKFSTGLLLLTNDGDFANRVIHPSKKVKKKYVVKLEKNIDGKHLEKLNKRMRLRDGTVYPKTKKLTERKILIELEEGRKHIIKRMIFKFGYFAKELKRIQIGKLKLDVKEGEWRYLRKEEVGLFK